jgi:hypothetical protein
VEGPNGQFRWVRSLNPLQRRARGAENRDMTSTPPIARLVAPLPPSPRLAELHRKAAEAAILRDGRLEIAIDVSGSISARVVAAE